MFDDEADAQENDIESQESTVGFSSSKSDESSGRLNDVARSLRSEEMPSWVKKLIESQQRAIEDNDKKLQDLCKEIRSLKRKRSKDDDEDFKWKKKGHKKQYVFNRSLEDQFQEIGTANQLLPARVAAEKGLELIKK